MAAKSPVQRAAGNRLAQIRLLSGVSVQRCACGPGGWPQTWSQIWGCFWCSKRGVADLISTVDFVSDTPEKPHQKRPHIWTPTGAGPLGEPPKARLLSRSAKYPEAKQKRARPCNQDTALEMGRRLLTQTLRQPWRPQRKCPNPGVRRRAHSKRQVPYPPAYQASLTVEDRQERCSEQRAARPCPAPCCHAATFQQGGELGQKRWGAGSPRPPQKLAQNMALNNPGAKAVL